MSENILLEKEVIPDDKLLKEKLASTYSYLTEIRQIVNETVGETTEEWKHYGKKYGWQLKNLFKKRNLYFIIICDGFFKIIFVFGDKAVSAIQKENISQNLKDELLAAKKYVEGRGLSIIVKDKKYLSDIKKLIEIKIKN